MKTLYLKIKNGIVNLIRWFPIIWEDRDWDDMFIYILLHKKFAHMEKFFRSDNCYSAKAEEVANELKLAKEICKRLINDDYLEIALTDYHKEYGHGGLYEIRPVEGRPYSEYVQIGTYEQHKKFDEAGNLSDYMERQDKELLFNHIFKHIYKWWD